MSTSNDLEIKLEQLIKLRDFYNSKGITCSLDYLITGEHPIVTDKQMAENYCELLNKLYQKLGNNSESIGLDFEMYTNDLLMDMKSNYQIRYENGKFIKFFR